MSFNRTRYNRTYARWSNIPVNRFPDLKVFSCGDTQMLSNTVAVVSVILVGKDIVGKKISDVRLSIYFPTSLLLNS